MFTFLSLYTLVLRYCLYGCCPSSHEATQMSYNHSEISQLLLWGECVPLLMFWLRCSGKPDEETGGLFVTSN